MGIIQYSKDKGIIINTKDVPLPKNIKQFRQTPELKSLYKFIHENDLRREAFLVIHNIFKIRKNTLKAK